MIDLLVGILLLVSSTLPFDVLVDKDHPLPADYNPGINSEAGYRLNLMIEAAEADGYEVVVVSGFRSYDYQAAIHEKECSWNTRCKDFSMEAGRSEHQLGTTFDLATEPTRSPDYGPNHQLWRWLKEHAHEFGFVESYPFKRCDEPPYSNLGLAACGVELAWEPWHWRFVGLELAQEIHEAEYLDPDSSVIPQDFYRIYPAETRENEPATLYRPK
ncbi:hypothetical protein GTO10_01630 [Candidatus Saccharibacteria bacterium]|nr:hypothetical protein [Candidatus Saccharibacteria bacterium]